MGTGDAFTHQGREEEEGKVGGIRREEAGEGRTGGDVGTVKERIGVRVGRAWVEMKEGQKEGGARREQTDEGRGHGGSEGKDCGEGRKGVGGDEGGRKRCRRGKQRMKRRDREGGEGSGDERGKRASDEMHTPMEGERKGSG
ncbi:hypothetical protein Pcinc_023887 [Petrolisthes cinctipes]|uniref:Uncharacterized protein n=1 Tax=Petrolisthes cinctipes TaxID=88211 RepID=A0AAE1FBY6_PETCI|nr:hypothetical protein Pcinc_023887 [Petrolisthes cinctipes]